jgi:anti-anti-sigma regulatory factor
MLTIAPGCEFEVERGPDWLLVRVRNLDLTDSETPQLAEYVRRVLQQHFTYRLVLELDGVESLTGDLIEQLVQLHQWIERHDGVMRLCGLSPANCQAWRSHQLDDELLTYEDREEAVMGCRHPPRPR